MHWGVMKRVVQYLAERFPLPVTSVHAMATAAMLVGVSATSHPIDSQLFSTALIALAFFFFMLRMRVTDEFKDRRHDDRNYPGRPVQRGLISRSTLIWLGITALSFELVFAFLAGATTGRPASIVWHLSILGFSVLTHFEFFAKRFLETHFNLYFGIHQLIFFLYPVWGFSIWATELNTQTLVGALSFVGYMSAMEIVRKYEIRLDPSGNVVRDTYLTVWGNGAFWAMFGISILGGIGLWFSNQHLAHLVISALVAIALLIQKSNTSAVRALVAFGFVAQSLAALQWL